MALCEFGCPSLEYVYDMTWSEFRIRQFAYNRQQEKDWFKIRELAYASIIGPHLDPKKVPSKEKFMPLGDKPGISEKMKERMKEAIKEYKEKKDAKSSVTSRNRSQNNRPGTGTSKSSKKPSKI